MTEIQLLYSADCPAYERALAVVHEVLAEERLTLEVRLISVDTEAEAREWQFPGSPTIRVNGIDIERSTTQLVALACRMYRQLDGSISAVPSKPVVRRAILNGVVGGETPA